MKYSDRDEVAVNREDAKLPAPAVIPAEAGIHGMGLTGSLLTRG